MSPPFRAGSSGVACTSGSFTFGRVGTKAASTLDEAQGIEGTVDGDQLDKTK
jgi:hypothetical protein